ncbi:MAG: non-canonical purine NTP pyrophosphatase, partial [Nitrospira sp.]|nr:non-canonical purine NTP pyrophosphatase [Nitrospira sp.]
RPGVYAARYAGEHATYEDNCRKLIQELHGVPPTRRTARFITVAALVLSSGGGVQVAAGELSGTITETSVGSKGFGYDPVFFVPELGKTLAELTPEEKNCVSHRAKAFLKLRELL